MHNAGKRGMGVNTIFIKERPTKVFPIILVDFTPFICDSWRPLNLCHGF